VIYCNVDFKPYILFPCRMHLVLWSEAKHHTTSLRSHQIMHTATVLGCNTSEYAYDLCMMMIPSIM
jgi:hypothetical protein